MNEERMYSVILASVVSEKTSMQAELSGQHTFKVCLLYTSPSPRDRQKSRMPSSA